jgi:hypothetical protein
MAVEPGGKAPYAPARTVQAVIERHRSHGLPRVDFDVLERIGVTEALRPRVLATLKLLDFYDESGRVTPEFDNLKRVAAADFPAHLALLLRKAYASILEVLGDPAQASPEQIEDAFRTFEPRGQLVRMVQLFTGLMVYAEVMSGGTRRKSGQSTKRKVIRRSQGSSGRSREPEDDELSLTGEGDEDESEPPLPSTSHSDGHDQRGYSLTVGLGDAGNVTLIVNVNPLLLSKPDRDFFYGLADAMQERASAQTSPASPAVGSTPTALEV